MKRIFLVIMFFVINACGGGGGATPMGSSTPTPTSTSSSSTSNYEVKVIDGYIDGANTFIDYNYNFIQDSEEPSATNADCEGCDGTYYFVGNSSFFSGINDWSQECMLNRITISEVPAGAVDATLGEITEPFTLFYIPYIKANDESAIEKVNVTPFTGLFLDAVAESMEELNIDPITAANGCGSDANNLANSVNQKAADFSTQAQQAMDTTDTESEVMEDLYSDFIEEGDNQQAQLSEKIVNFLQTASDINEVFKAHYNNEFDPQIFFSDDAIDLLYGDNDFTALPFSINIANYGPADSDGWQKKDFLFTSGLRLLQNGKIVDQSCAEVDTNNCVQIDPTFQNILNSVEYFRSYGGHENQAIIPGTNIENQYISSKQNVNESINCDEKAMLNYIETKSCAGNDCPDNISYESEISHNIGFDVPVDCDISNDPFILISIDQKNTFSFSPTWNGEDHYAAQLGLKNNSSIYSNPVLNFLGANKNNLDYTNTYNNINNLFFTMDTIENLETQLNPGESLSLRRIKQDPHGNGELNFWYYVSRQSNNELTKSCTEYTWDSQQQTFYTDNSATSIEEEGAFAACYNFVNAFNFHNE